jgi:PAS domain S-box-containing protein
MKPLFKLILLSAASALHILAAFLPGRAQDLNFEHLTDADGLSQNAVFCILQDRQGFMWFGTQDGLNRYDGYSFTVFRHDPQDINSISDNYITALYEDRGGKLWIGTQSGGLNKFDPITETFVRYRHDPLNPGSLSHNHVSSLHEDSEALWVGTHGGLNRLNRATNQFTRYLHDATKPNSLSDNYINAIHVDRRDMLRIGTAEGGLNRYDRATSTGAAGSFTHFVHDPNNPNSLRDNYVLTIFEDKSGALWLGTGSHGLNKLEPNENQSQDRQTAKFRRYVCQVSAMTEDNEGMLWIGSKGLGLYRFDKAKEQFARFVHDPNNPYSLSDAGILSAYVDRAGDLWLGTHGYGINKYSRTGKAFRHYVRTLAYPKSLANRSVRAIHEDEQGVLWIGGYEGLDKFNRVTGAFTHYQPDATNPASIPGKDVFVIYPDPASAGKIFLIGFESNQGLAKFDRTTGRFTPYPPDPAGHRSLIRHPVYALHRERSGMLWIGTDAGLFKYDETKNDLRQYRHDPQNPQSLGDDRILSLCEDATGALWVGTEGGGLHRFERAARKGLSPGRFIRYRHDPRNPFSLSNDRIKCIFTAKDGTIWIGTDGGGLNRFDREHEKFLHYTTKDGLPNDVVYGILEDEPGNLWLSTNKGISKFNPQTQTFKNYEAGDGLQSNEFNTGAYFKSPASRGEMFFGGINGVTAFFPDQIKDNPYVPPIVLTGFRKFNQPVRLDTAIAAIKKIKLNYDDAVFSFEFAALNYTAPEKNQYAFRLEGFNDDWVELGTKREVTFTNLDPGEYILRVKGSNNDGVWNEAGASIAISIAPAFYQTNWFVALCALMLGLTVYGGYRWRLSRLEAREKQLERLVAERTEQLRESEAKLRAIFDNTPDFIVVIDRSHRIQFINHTASGFEMKKVIGTDIYAYLQPEYHEMMRNAVQRVFESGGAERLEHKGAGPDGKISWYLTTIAPLPRDDKVKAIAMLATDITERKRTEEGLKHREELFRNLAESITAGAFIFYGTKMRYVNSAAERISGYTREELLAMDFWEVIHPDFRTLVKARGMARQRGEPLPSRYEVKLLTKQGEERWIDFTATLIEFEGRPAVLGTALDVTARKQTEEALRESESRYRSLVEQMPDGLYRSTPGGKFIEVNPAMARMFGYSSKEELLSADIPRQLYFDPNDREQAVALLKQKGNQAILPVRHRRKDGREVWSEAHARLICDDQGNVLYHEGILRDITERRRLEKQLRQHTENLEQLVEARTAHIRELEKQRIETEKLAATGRMAARIAHEINNPLGSIHTAFRLISRAVPPEHRHHHYVGKIEKEIARISRIVRQMLELHKPHVEAPKAFRPDVAIEEVLALLKPQCRERHVDFKPDLERARSLVTLPENMLRQILYNVILNAQEASPPNGLVLVTAQADGQNLDIAVADHGEGIPEEIKTRIFEPFFTTKSNGSSGGMGLGLSICKNLVEAMNGAITIDSKAGEGTICQITIPLDQSKNFEKV